MSLERIKREAREKVLHIIEAQDCSCGFGEPRGPQCDCGYEAKLSTYLSHRFLDTFADRLLEGVEKAVVPDTREGKWKCECGREYFYDEHNYCVGRIIGAFAKFRGKKAKLNELLPNAFPEK